MNLKEKYGKRFRVTLDASYQHEKEDGKSKNEWQYHEIKGRHGYLYPFSLGQAAVTFTSNVVANRYSGRKWKMLQNGEDERTLLIPPEDIEEVLGAIQPRKRRQISPEQRLKAMERLKKYAFNPGSNPKPPQINHIK